MRKTRAKTEGDKEREENRDRRMKATQPHTILTRLVKASAVEFCYGFWRDDGRVTLLRSKQK